MGGDTYVRRILTLLLAVQVALVVAHLLAFELAESAADPRHARRILDFNQENSIPTYWSAIVMAAAGARAALVAAKMGLRGAGHWWLLLGAGFGWLALEEVAHFHEDAEIASGVDWPFIYAPLLLLGAWVVVATALDLPSGRRRLLLGGLALLAAAVAFELFPNLGIAVAYDFRNVIEENLELGGAGLVLAAAAGRARELSPLRLGREQHAASGSETLAIAPQGSCSEPHAPQHAEQLGPPVEAHRASSSSA